LCTVCRNQMPLTEFTFDEENAVDRIFYGRIPVEKAAAFLFYGKKGIVKNLIHALKYAHQPQIGVFLADWWGEQLKAEGLGQRINGVVPVPLHPAKLRRRGYNQVALFARGLADKLQVDLLDSVLVKTSNNRTQTTKNRWYRWEGSRGHFCLADSRAVENKSILLVDDVLTTGATLEACARALQTAHGTRVYIASMAVVP